jgi:hypothetical protein
MSLFEYRAYSKHPAIKLQAQALIEEMLKDYRRKPPKARISSLTKWMKTAVAALFHRRLSKGRCADSFGSQSLSWSDKTKPHVSKRTLGLPQMAH